MSGTPASLGAGATGVQASTVKQPVDEGVRRGEEGGKGGEGVRE